MISLPQLKCFIAAYPEAPPRTTSLEQRIRIGTGFHGKWYRSQREHMLGWMVVQECQARMKHKDPASIDAKGMWGRLKCSPSMFWLAECAGVRPTLLDKAEAQAEAATKINSQDGDPHGRMMREVLPWPILEQAILAGQSPAEARHATTEARRAFDRLTSKVANYRRHRDWLPCAS